MGRTGGSSLTWYIFMVKLWGEGLEADGGTEKGEGLLRGGELKVEMNTAQGEEERQGNYSEEEEGDRGSVGRESKEEESGWGGQRREPI